MTEITIAPVAAADAPEIAEIYAFHVTYGVATFELQPPSTDEMAQRIARVQALGHPWLGARDVAGCLVGYAYASNFHPREAYGFTCEDSIYVRNDRLGTGVGSALLAELISAARACGFRQMVALITGGVAGSMELHQRFGFVEAGRLAAVGFKHGSWLDVVLMQRSLVQIQVA